MWHYDIVYVGIRDESPYISMNRNLPHDFDDVVDDSS